MSASLVNAILVCVALGAAVACSDDDRPERYVSVGDAGDGDGDDDSGADEDGGADEPDFGRTGYDRFCNNWAFGTCTEALLEPFNECRKDVCRPHYRACRGTCREYLECVDGCDCRNRACIALCELSSECMIDCIRRDCDVQKVCLPLFPACYVEPQEYSCAELDECCKAIAGSQFQAECEEVVASGDPSLCWIGYVDFCDLTQSSE